MERRAVNVCNCGEHAWVTLTRGLVSFIDPEFASAIGLWSWFARRERSNWYAARSDHIVTAQGRKTFTVTLHSVILQVPPGYLADHLSGDTLDNRRSNLRPATTSQNAANQKRRAGGTSQYKGVSRCGAYWRAGIGSGGRQSYLGTFENESDAARAYDAAALALHGEFARLNFPQQQERAA